MLNQDNRFNDRLGVFIVAGVGDQLKFPGVKNGLIPFLEIYNLPRLEKEAREELAAMIEERLCYRGLALRQENFGFYPGQVRLLFRDEWGDDWETPKFTFRDAFEHFSQKASYSYGEYAGKRTNHGQCA